jgi:hypothetical protein
MRRHRKEVDEQSVTSAWRELNGVAAGLTPADTRSSIAEPPRASYAASCPRCSELIAIGQEIRRHRDFVHARGRTKPGPVEKGRPETGLTTTKVTPPRSVRESSVCCECDLEHRGTCG